MSAQPKQMQCFRSILQHSRRNRKAPEAEQCFQVASKRHAAMLPLTATACTTAGATAMPPKHCNAPEAEQCFQAHPSSTKATRSNASARSNRLQHSWSNRNASEELQCCRAEQCFQAHPSSNFNASKASEAQQRI